MDFHDEILAGSGIQEFESKLGTKSGFFRSLLSEDDWSFVIKLHALFEAASTHLLLFHFREPQLTEIVSHLELSNRRTGKIAILKSLGLLDKESRRFIYTLSELRNSLVHDVRNAQFSLMNYVDDLDTKSLGLFAEAFSPHEGFKKQIAKISVEFIKPDDPIWKPADTRSLIDRLKRDPKFHIWFGSLHVLTSMIEMYSYSDYLQWSKAKEILFDEAL